MDEVFNVIGNNLCYVFSVIVLVFIFQLSNLLFGLGDNLAVKGEKFNHKKILSWVIRTALTLAGLFFLVVGVSLIPYIITLSGIKIPDEYGDFITIAMILLTSIKTMYNEAQKAYEHYVNIANR